VTRSGTPTTPNERRGRKMVTITLSDAAREALDRLAKIAGNRSAAAEAAILSAYATATVSVRSSRGQ
jgi:predicted transcriptional regulator